MAKTKTPRTSSPRSKKNGTEIPATPTVAAAVESLVSEVRTEALEAPVKAQEAKPEIRAVEPKSENKEPRKTFAEARRKVVPINLDEEIRRRAYQLYEERGCTPGHENDDWLVAEREILTRYTSTQRQHSA